MASASKNANPSGSHVPTRDNHEPESYVSVTDGERMKVQPPGRLPMQRVFLLRGSTDGKSNEKDPGLTNKAYNVKADDPVMNPVGQRPSAQEFLPGSDVVPYLEVGIVIGDDPSRFKPTPLENKKNKEDRKQRGDIPRHTSAIRAFIHVAPTVAPQAKYVVGVKPIDGYLQPRMIESECIFFYPEFWKGIEKAPKKARKALMNTRVKQPATDTKTQDEPATATTTAEEVASLDLGQGVKSFVEFDKELRLEDAVSVAQDLRVRRT
jgi:hypothetical protein